MVCIMVVMIWGTFFGSLKSRQLPPIVVEAAACNGYSDYSRRNKAGVIYSNDDVSFSCGSGAG